MGYITQEEQAFIRSLGRPDLQDEATFYRLVNNAIDLTEISYEELASELVCTPDVVKSWHEGRGAPEPEQRESVYRVLRKAAHICLLPPSAGRRTNWSL